MMKRAYFALMALLLSAAVVAAIAAESKPAAKPKAPPKPAPKVLPRLLELGANKCVPCKMMKPILDELEKKYKDKLTVEFIDVCENPKEAEKYKVKAIPTQVFFDTKGKEFFRHTGFYPKEDILKAFKRHGIDLDKPTPKPPAKPKK